MSTLAQPVAAPPARWGARLAPYLEFTRVGFVNILAFRLRYYTGIVTYLINVTVYYFIWRAVYGPAAGATTTLAGYDLGQMLTYAPFPSRRRFGRRGTGDGRREMRLPSRPLETRRSGPTRT